MQIGIVQLVGGLVAIALLLGGAFTVGTKWDAEPASQEASAGVAIESEESLDVAEEIPAPEGVPLYKVLRVVDGDTIVVEIDGKSESLRMIGIDTPELNDSRTGVQCFAKEAAERMKTLVIGKKVRLEKDATQGERDKYKRLLAYVFREDGLFLNRALIAEGYGHEYTYDGAYKYQKEFKAAESGARSSEAGLWAPDVCPPAKEAKKEASTTAKTKTTTSTQAAAAATAITPPPPVPEVVQQMTAPMPELVQKQPEPIPTPPASSSSVVCTANTYNCTDFKTKKEAQQVYEQCGGAANDIHRLDNNKDGSACDSLP